jgi:sec-independent protein translocase protein TatC
MALFKFLNRKKADATAEMSFIDHLDVLRGHLFRAVIAIVAGAIAIAVFNDFFIQKIIMGPTHSDFPTYRMMCRLAEAVNIPTLCMGEIPVKMQNTTVAGQFSMFFSVVLIGGVVIAFPYILYEFWRFIKPALTKKELNKTKGVIFWVSLLFFSGVLFGYFIIAPYTINFFSNFQLDEAIENRWTITSYIHTLTPLILGTGLAFQLPLVMFFLAKVGIVTGKFLKANRKYGIVLIFVLAGIITPGPDLISQISVALPLLILYEVSIVLTKRVEAERAKAELEEWD